MKDRQFNFKQISSYVCLLIGHVKNHEN